MAKTPASNSDDKLGKMSVEELEAEVRHHNQLYWDKNSPEISDYDYDRLVNRLKAVAPDSPVLEEMGPTAAAALPEVRHEVPMLSLDKCYADADLESWTEKFEGDVLVMPKMDGIAASLRFDDKGRLQLAATRGNGQVGEDFTANARTIADIPGKLAGGKSGEGRREAPKALEVRGEVYMRLSVFAAYREQFSNPRNLAAGAIKHKDSQRCRDYKLSFGAYDLVGADLPTEKEKFARLAELGFSPVTAELVKRSEVHEAYQRFAARRADLDFEIDGVVFKADTVAEQKRLGATAHHPRYAMAYKFQGDSGQSVLRHVEWSVARSGAITPVAHIDPVTLSGASVSRASLHNVGFLTKLGLLHQPYGAKLVVTRRGGVIPHVEFVAEPAPKAKKSDPTIELPTECPSCGGPVRQQKDFIYCAKPESCRAAVISALSHYCAAFDILGFGEKLLCQAYDAGLLRSPVDLYLLTEEKLLGLERVGPKLATKLIKEVNDRREVRLSVFLRALGIDDLGRHVSDILEERYGDLGKIRRVTVEELAGIHSIGTEISKNVVKGLKDKAPLIADLLKHVKLVVEKKAAAGGEGAAAGTAGGRLAGQSFVFTGTLTVYDRKTAQKKVAALGGETPDGVSKTLTYLVVGAEERKSSKIVKAEKLVAEGHPLKIISEQDFLKMIGEKTLID
jgi:DNA ligase (NAD+)